MPSAIAVGVPYDLFWHLNPRKLEPFFKAFEITRKMNDEQIWSICGTYLLSALTVAIDRCFKGRKSKTKYIEKPITSEAFNKKEEFTEEELQKQRELFVAKLLTMQANFELNHKTEVNEYGNNSGSK